MFSVKDFKFDFSSGKPSEGWLCRAGKGSLGRRGRAEGTLPAPEVTAMRQLWGMLCLSSAASQLGEDRDAHGGSQRPTVKGACVQGYRLNAF